MAQQSAVRTKEPRPIWGPHQIELGFTPGSIKNEGVYKSADGKEHVVLRAVAGIMGDYSGILIRDFRPEVVAKAKALKKQYTLGAGEATRLRDEMRELEQSWKKIDASGMKNDAKATMRGQIKERVAEIETTERPKVKKGFESLNKGLITAMTSVPAWVTMLVIPGQSIPEIHIGTEPDPEKCKFKPRVIKAALRLTHQSLRNKEAIAAFGGEEKATGFVTVTNLERAVRIKGRKVKGRKPDFTTRAMIRHDVSKGGNNVFFVAISGHNEYAALQEYAVGYAGGALGRLLVVANSSLKVVRGKTIHEFWTEAAQAAKVEKKAE